MTRKKYRTALKAERLRKVLFYDPETGNFDRLPSSRRKNRCAAGSVADKGYIVIMVDGVLYRANRLAWLYMTGFWPERDVDHENGNKSDNRWKNLREATVSQNRANSVTPRTNEIGLKGVSWKTANQKWVAQIKVDGKKMHLGLFDCPFEAASAYEKAAKRYFGEFACTGKRKAT